MEQPKQDFAKQSLANQIADYALKLADREAVITSQYQKIKDLEKELEEYRSKEIEEMDDMS